jgi:hypothetical protein
MERRGGRVEEELVLAELTADPVQKERGGNRRLRK